MNVIEEYDKQSLYHMLLKCFYHLHSMEKFKIGCVKQVVDEDSNFEFLIDCQHKWSNKKKLILILFFSKHIYKPKEMLFIYFDFYEKKLIKWS